MTRRCADARVGKDDRMQGGTLGSVHSSMTLLKRSAHANWRCFFLARSTHAMDVASKSSLLLRNAVGPYRDEKKRAETVRQYMVIVRQQEQKAAVSSRRLKRRHRNSLSQGVHRNQNDVKESCVVQQQARERASPVEDDPIRTAAQTHMGVKR